MGWLRLIPDDRFVIPRIVACRRLVRPHAGRHLFPWHRPVTRLGADHKGAAAAVAPSRGGGSGWRPPHVRGLYTVLTSPRFPAMEVIETADAPCLASYLHNTGGSFRGTEQRLVGVKHTMRNALAALAALAIATPASAAVVITSPLPGGTTIVMPATTYTSQSGVGLQYFVPGVAWYSSVSPFFGYSLLGTTLDQPLGDNGVWSGSPGYASLAAPMGSMYFSFLNPVAAVGGFLNFQSPADPELGEPTIEVLTLNNFFSGNYDAHVLTISTPGGVNAGAFYGFQEDDNLIYGFKLSNAYIVLRDLTVWTVQTDTPEPASLGLLGAGLLGLAAARRRRG